MSILITGNTFPVRKHLVAMGARSVRDAAGKFVGWEVPDEMLAAARKLVADAEELPCGTRAARAMRANTDAVVMAPVPVAAPVRPAPAPTVTVTVAPDVPLDPWALLEEGADLLRRVLSLAGDRPLGIEAAGWLRRYGQTQAQRLDAHVDAAAARQTPWEPVARQDAPQAAPQAAQDAPGGAGARQVTLRAAPAAAAPQEAPRSPQEARTVTVRAQVPPTPAKPATGQGGALAWALGK